ncbi:hypothetical protein C0993_006418, partial [Termitomyces sp. T159_Od127]
SLNTALIPRTYLVSNTLSAADVAIYGALRTPLPAPAPAVLRDALAHALLRPRPVAAPSAPPALPSPPARLTSRMHPRSSVKPSLRRKKEKKPAAADSGASTPAPASAAPSPAPSTSASAQKPQKTEKKEKKKKDASAEQQSGNKGAANAPAADDGEPVPSMIDLRIGKIIDIILMWIVSASSKSTLPLLGRRTRDRRFRAVHIMIEHMRDQFLVGVCNLKPANMRGVKSFAMVVRVSYFFPLDGISIRPSSRPSSLLNQKKIIFKTIQQHGFTTLETQEAAWLNPATKSVHKVHTKDGFRIARTFCACNGHLHVLL